jgi:hypothetical protein
MTTEHDHRRPHLALAGTTPAERIRDLEVTAHPVPASA